MRAPLQYWFDRSFTSEYARQIDAEYQLSVVAENAVEIKEAQHKMLATQVLIADRMQQANVEQKRASAQAEQDRVEIIRGIRDLHIEIQAQRADIREAFAGISGQLAELSEGLWRIEDILRNPNRTLVDEHTRLGHKLFRRGNLEMDNRRRALLFSDAMRALEAAFSNPLGADSPQCSFLLGWLNWNHKGDIGAAEEFFFRAATVADGSDSEFVTLALRHQGNMLYKLGRFTEAVEAVSRACRITRWHPDAWFELARYASKSGNEQVCNRALTTAISLRPIIRRTLLSEPDFYA